MPASATNSVDPLGESANASGWAPTGTPLPGDSVCVRRTNGRRPVTSTTLIVSSLVLATKSRVELSDSCTAEGWCPTRTYDDSCHLAGSLAAMSTTDTVPPTPCPRPTSSPQLATYSRLCRVSTASPMASSPTGMRATTASFVASSTVTRPHALCRPGHGCALSLGSDSVPATNAYRP